MRSSVLIIVTATFFSGILAGCGHITGGRQDAQAPPDATTEMQKVLDAYASMSLPDSEPLTLRAIRRHPSPADAVTKALLDQGKTRVSDPAVTKKTLMIPVQDGTIPIHVFTPKGIGPYPALLYFHGGGFVAGDTAGYETSPRSIAQVAEIVVVSVDYRLAPEHPFPAALADVLTAFEWTVDHVDQLHINSEQIAVGGEGAGGNLAASMSMVARDNGIQPPRHQLLIYPILDNNTDTFSYRRNAHAEPLNMAKMCWMLVNYIKRREDADSHYAFPLKAKTLKGLPSATIISAEIDPLISENRRYTERLRKEGVDVVYEEYKGVSHDFFGMRQIVPEANNALQFAAD